MIDTTGWSPPTPRYSQRLPTPSGSQSAAPGHGGQQGEPEQRARQSCQCGKSCQGESRSGRVGATRAGESGPTSLRGRLCPEKAFLAAGADPERHQQRVLQRSLVVAAPQSHRAGTRACGRAPARRHWRRAPRGPARGRHARGRWRSARRAAHAPRRRAAARARSPGSGVPRSASAPWPRGNPRRSRRRSATQAHGLWVGQRIQERALRPRVGEQLVLQLVHARQVGNRERAHGGWREARAPDVARAPRPAPAARTRARSRAPARAAPPPGRPAAAPRRPGRERTAPRAGMPAQRCPGTRPRAARARGRAPGPTNRTS